MKKFTLLSLALLLILSLAACSKKGSDEGEKAKVEEEKQEKKDNIEEENKENKEEKQENIVLDKKLTEMIDEITKGLELPNSAVYELDEELFEAYAFIKKGNGMEGVVSQAQMSTQPHSLVLIRTEDQDTESLAKEVSEKANIRKWICVEAEMGKVLYGKNYVFLVMTYKDAYESLKANFEKVTGIEDAKAFNVEAKDPYQ